MTEAIDTSTIEFEDIVNDQTNESHIKVMDLLMGYDVEQAIEDKTFNEAHVTYDESPETKQKCVEACFKKYSDQLTKDRIKRLFATVDELGFKTVPCPELPDYKRLIRDDRLDIYMFKLSDAYVAETYSDLPYYKQPNIISNQRDQLFAYLTTTVNTTNVNILMAPNGDIYLIYKRSDAPNTYMETYNKHIDNIIRFGYSLCRPIDVPCPGSLYMPSMCTKYNVNYSGEQYYPNTYSCSSHLKEVVGVSDEELSKYDKHNTSVDTCPWYSIDKLASSDRFIFVTGKDLAKLTERMSENEDKVKRSTRSVEQETYGKYCWAKRYINVLPNLKVQELDVLRDAYRALYKYKAMNFKGHEVFNMLISKGFAVIPQKSKSDILVKHGGWAATYNEEDVMTSFYTDEYTQGLLQCHKMFTLDFDASPELLERFNSMPNVYDEDTIYEFTSICINNIIKAFDLKNVNACVTPSGGFHLIFRARDRTNVRPTITESIKKELIKHACAVSEMVCSNKYTKIPVDDKTVVKSYSGRRIHVCADIPEQMKDVEVKGWHTAPGSLYWPTNCNSFEKFKKKGMFIGRSYRVYGTWKHINSLDYLEDVIPLHWEEKIKTYKSNGNWLLTDSPVKLTIGNGSPIDWSIDTFKDMLKHIEISTNRDTGTYDKLFMVFSCLKVIANCNDSEVRDMVFEFISRKCHRLNLPEEQWKAIYHKIDCIGTVPEILLLKAIKNGWRPKYVFEPADYASKMNVSLLSKKHTTWNEILGLVSTSVMEYEDVIESRLSYKKMLMDCIFLDNSTGMYYIKSESGREYMYIKKKKQDFDHMFYIPGTKESIGVNVRFTTSSARGVWKKEMMKKMPKGDLKNPEIMRELDKEAESQQIIPNFIPLLKLFGEIVPFVTYTNTIVEFSERRGIWTDRIPHIHDFPRPIVINICKPFKPIWRVDPNFTAFDNLLQHIVYLIGSDDGKTVISDRMSIHDILKEPYMTTARVFVNWLSCVFKGIKTTVAPFLFSTAKGTGKTLMASVISKALMGLSVPVQDMETLLRKNQVLEHAYLMYDGECPREYPKSLMASMKQIVTDSEMAVNSMCENIRVSKNRLNCLFISNYRSTLRFEEGNRRWIPIHLIEDMSIVDEYIKTILRARNELYTIPSEKDYGEDITPSDMTYITSARRTKYFGTLVDMMSSEAALHGIYKGFTEMESDVSYLKYKSRRILDLETELINVKMNVASQFIIHILTNTARYHLQELGKYRGMVKEPATELYQRFKNWYKQEVNDHNEPLAVKTFSEQMLSINGVSKVKNSSIYYIIDCDRIINAYVSAGVLNADFVTARNAYLKAFGEDREGFAETMNKIVDECAGNGKFAGGLKIV